VTFDWNQLVVFDFDWYHSIGINWLYLAPIDANRPN